MGKSFNHKEPKKEAKDGEVQKLKRLVRRLEQENRHLKSQLRTYERAYEKTVVFLQQKTTDFDLEELIDGANKELNLREIKEERKIKFEDMKAKWKCFKCEGVMRLIIIPQNRYFRKCSLCDNRTDTKEYEELPEGITEA